MNKIVSHNNLEKLIFSLGLLVVLVLLGYLVFEMTDTKKKPPHLVVTTAYDPNVPNYAYKIKTKNFGENTAANVNVKLDLYQEGKKVESATVNFNYLPVQSTETAWTIFHLPRKEGDSLVVGSIAFSKP